MPLEKRGVSPSTDFVPMAARKRVLMNPAMTSRMGLILLSAVAKAGAAASPTL
jgi:hypothetical protein